MRALVVVLVGSLVSGCATDSYRIPPGELARLAHTAPDTRGQRVRVVQEVVATDVPAAPVVRPETQTVFVPQLDFSGSIQTGGGGPHGGGGGGIGHIGGGGGDGKGLAIAVLVIAATVMITAAAIEGSRFDGYAALHPMHPVHLIGHDGRFAVVPLAWLDDEAVAWADQAIIKPSEGPWHPIERAPLDRQGLTYSMYGGYGSLRSALGDLALGPAWTIQLGYFPTQELGILVSEFFGWRDNRYAATLFEARTTGELQYLPVQLGRLHGGLYGGVGFASRFEDAIKLSGDHVVAGDETTAAFVGGAMVQLDLTTRLALTGRLGIARAHDEEMHDVMIGLSVY
jgi:hypothetical protein